MDAENIEAYLQCNYGHHTLVTYRAAKKHYLRVESVRRDIYFLKSCRAKDIIPMFLWFKTANENLFSSREYKECQRRLLKAEINHKYQHLREVTKSYHSSISLLRQCCPDEVFQNVQQIITTICSPALKKKEQTIENKLLKYSRGTKPKSTTDPNVVRNFSARILSRDEIDCLAHGLDYSLVPKRFDHIGAVVNVEQFFHRVTDVFQNQKKLMSDLKDKDVVMQNDIRVLNTKEMTLACSLRSLTDSFCFQADRYRKRQHRIHEEQRKYHRLLKQLRQDKSIIVTRFDKGRGIVLMNKTDYISKMNAILNDSTKFNVLSDDPTIKREARLTRLLSKLKKNGHISDEFYDMARPTGSNPGRLYGLPKVHKEDVPLRPVLSSIGTYNYGLAKALKQMLSNIVQNKAIIKDSFTFVKELQSLSKRSSESEKNTVCCRVF